MASNENTPVKAPDVDAEGTESPEGVDTHPDNSEAAETFSAEYVSQLRTEAAEARVKLQRLDEYEAKMFDVIAGDEAAKLLRDPSDFVVSDRAALLGEDGYPSREKIADAVSSLVAAKPYLARVAGDVGQGVRPEPEPEVSLGGLLRIAAQ